MTNMGNEINLTTLFDKINGLLKINKKTAPRHGAVSEGLGRMRSSIHH